MRRAASLLLLIAFVAGCGGGAASGEADPATAVPRDALFYLEVSVRPEGAVKEDALAAAGKLLRTADPGARIVDLLNSGLEDEGGDVDYERDIAPWLGERAGLWVSRRLDESEEPGVGIAVAATDLEAACASSRR
jgi:hypothetical protein